jgi:8-oxo-dGTP pyrophosphatase MutT (NUDIX family)
LGPDALAPFAPRLAEVLAATPPRLVTRVPELVFEAGVSLLLRDRDGPELLFIKRAERAGDPWSGQIAFPGGRRQAEDASLQETARRETSEEVGLDPALTGRYLGALDECEPGSKRLPPLVIAPFVWAVPSDAALAPSAPEVDQLLWVGLEALRDARAAITFTFAERSFPAIQIGPYVLWGLTWRIVQGFLPLAATAGV